MAFQPLNVITGSQILAGDDTCNPLPGFVPTYNPVGADVSPGCKLYPEVIMNGGVANPSITFEPGLWGPTDEFA
eukprot:CAMPEP_0184308352 /NCGR_PEP_ID=MMETSP1049-20130417/16827_1 /TAXON_ID=77928 /ORGANISM="Proteomonas sulcata, Strain CCMP704" /LENGTH=73 /DNA_ID=CAMNT_0026621013 /DNA_START=413 /DNA_END=634 /DNA_ORIENTATION=+